MQKSQDKRAMRRVRCAICRMHLQDLKLLKTHYMRHHSKFQLVDQILKLAAVNTRKAMVGMKCRKKTTSLDEIQIAHNDNTALIVNEHNKENLVKVVPEDVQTSTKSSNCNKKYVAISCNDNQHLKGNKKMKKLLPIRIKKVTEISKSLEERTGEFYKCHCMEKSSRQNSDTESSLNIGKVLRCFYCRNCYQTQNELNQHVNQHKFYCRLCNQNLTSDNQREHMLQHFIRNEWCGESGQFLVQ